jgi:hypothetical protein
MNGQNAAVVFEPAPRWKAWIWFSGMEVPEEDVFECMARVHGEKKEAAVTIYLESRSHDEVRGQVVFEGGELEPGAVLRLSVGKDEVGLVHMLEVLSG